MALTGGRRGYGGEVDADHCSAPKHSRSQSTISLTSSPSFGNRVSTAKTRTRTRTRTAHHGPLSLIQLLVLLVCFCSFTSASSALFTIPDELVDLSEITSAQERLAKSAPILVDQRPPPVRAGKTWTLGNLEDELALRKRATDDDTSASASASASSAAASTKATSTLASSASASGTSATTTATATATASALPTPFDSGIGTNYLKESCPNFLNSFLDNSTFLGCVPVSLMLQNSLSFFNAEKSITTISQVLDASCSVDITTCNNLMETLAANLTTADNCLDDYNNNQPFVVAAELGLQAYFTIYQATCLRDASTSAYCFAEAITNASSPSDSYPYYLPLNSSLPGGSQPTCNSCLQGVMAIFDTAAANRSLAIASTYVSAAEQIDVQCGPTFVNETLPVALVSSAPVVLSSVPSILTLVAMFAAWVL